MLKPQDIVVSAKLALTPGLTYPELSRSLEISQSVAHGAVKRAIAAGLVDRERRTNKTALLDFLVQGIARAFPPKRGAITRGVPTAHAAPPLDELIGSTSEPPPVWPDADGTVRGESFAPLYRSVPRAAKKDEALYQVLCLVDAIRGGRPRDRALAAQELRRRLVPARDVGELTGARALSAGPRRQRILSGLANKIGPGATKYYRSALDLMALRPPLDATTHLVMHLAREIESALRGVLNGLSTTFVVEEKTSKTEGHRRSIMASLEVLGIERDGPLALSWMLMTGLKGKTPGFHARAHRRGLGQPRPFDADFVDHWNRFEEVLDDVLQKLSDNYEIVYGRLDELLAMSSAAEAAETLSNAFPQDPKALEYFFGRLDDPRWIDPLNARGFFSEPFALGDSDQGHSDWPALQYLARMADQAPEKVRPIALAIHGAGNPLVQRTLIRIASRLPPSDGVAFVPRVDEWLRTADAGVEIGATVERLVDWTDVLVQAGEAASALEIVGALLAPARAEPDGGDESPARLESRLNDWSFKRTISRVEPLLARIGLASVGFLSDVVSRAHELAYRGKPIRQDIDDALSSRRAFIGNDPPRFGDGFFDALVDLLRDTAVAVVGSTPASLREVVANIEHRGWPILRRVGLYLAERFSSQDREFVNAKALNHSTFYVQFPSPEYARLVRTTFYSWSDEEKAMFLSWLADGPPRMHDDASAYGYLSEYWMLRWLLLLPGDLPSEWNVRRANLGEGHPGSRAWDEFDEGIRFHSGPTSPMDVTDMARMSAADAIKAIASWHPSGEFGAPEPEGLSRTLSADVQHRPDDYSDEVENLRELDATYLRGAVNGFRGAAQSGRSLRWKEVLRLCASIMAQPWDIRGRKGKHRDFDHDRGQLRLSVLRLVEEGLISRQVPIAPDLRGDVWEVVGQGITGPDKEPATSFGQSDPVTQSLNRICGVALHTAIEYAAWLARSGAEKRLPLEIRAVLQQRAVDPRAAVRAVYGRRMHQLVAIDKTWCREHCRAIFSAAGGRDDAWEAYLGYGRLTPEGFRVLRWRYVAAVAALEDAPDLGEGRDQNVQALAEHLMLLYWHGRIDFSDRDHLLDRFFSNAKPSVRSGAMARIGYWLADEPSPNDEILDRLKTLWHRRAAVADAEELAAYGTWFVAQRFDAAWSLKQLALVLDHDVLPEPSFEVVDVLATATPRDLGPSLACLDRMVRAGNKGWGVYLWANAARRLLSRAIEAQDGAVRTLARTTISHLCEKGHPEYRELLPRVGSAGPDSQQTS